MQTTTL